LDFRLREDSGKKLITAGSAVNAEKATRQPCRAAEKSIFLAQQKLITENVSVVKPAQEYRCRFEDIPERLYSGDI